MGECFVFCVSLFFVNKRANFAKINHSKTFTFYRMKKRHLKICLRNLFTCSHCKNEVFNLKSFLQIQPFPIKIGKICTLQKIVIFKKKLYSVVLG